jgi:amino-acid N-acetyltransferase
MTHGGNDFVAWFRQASPYIHAHRGRTFVLAFGGEAVSEPGFANLVHDVALLHGLGIRLVLVHGARPQIEERLALRGAEISVANGLRITDAAALACVKEAAGTVRVDIEALLSMGLANSPMAGMQIRVASGNFVTARPLGVLDGIDYGLTGEVRRVDAEAIRQRLDAGAVALVPPLGYSPTGEVFNLSAADVAQATAVALHADKLIMLVDERVADSRGRLISSMVPREVDELLARRRRLTERQQRVLRSAATACRGGVARAHILDRRREGVLLTELFTRDGCGTLVTAEPYEVTRTATIDDVGGILELIAPMEQAGILVPRPRDMLENEIERFTVMERDGTVIACAALFPFPEAATGELACVAVHPDYRNSGRGDRLLGYMEDAARGLGLEQIFVLTTRTAHWFRERGFQPTEVATLPPRRRDLYNWRRNSKAFVKTV